MKSENQTVRLSLFGHLGAVRMLIGAGIGLAVILFFVLGIDNPHPSWSPVWWIRPVLVVPIAGATGAAFFHFMDWQRKLGKVNLFLAWFISTMVFIAGLWIGIVVGLDGTMWN